MSKATKGNIVGRVVGIWRYPVKSMGPENLESADVSWAGIAGDRRWAFVRDEAVRSGFPWLTIRERADMNHYQPTYADPARPEKSATEIRTPTGTVFDITDPALAEELYPAGTRVIRQDRGIFDTFPLSLISTQTISTLGQSVGMDLKPQRFRPNFLIEATDDAPFQEDDWVGCTLRIGEARIRVDQRDGRCVVITIDPDTHERKPEVLQTVYQEREGCLGVYASVVKPGLISLEDEVILETVA